jgi:regulator of protease activity HflC (stomatin/prohibitin superfamily)
MELNEVLNGTEEINVNLYESVKDITAGYGLSIDRINIGEISVSNEIINSMNKLITASRDKESLITISEGKKQSVILESEAKSSEMQIDAEARARQTKIDADARAERTKIDAAAEAERIEKITEAETSRIREINKAIAESNLTDEMIAYLGIEAFKHVVENNGNTVIMPSNLTELGNVPAIKEIWKQTN